MNVTTRIPPSPTGNLHVGTARAALFNYLFARKHEGRFLFRSEDTDKARSLPEHEIEIREGLAWLGLSWDDFSRQSEQTEKYKGYLEQLISSDKAYLSKEPRKDNPEEEVEVVRLRNSGQVITFTDLVRGEVTFDTTELGDIVIARALDDPLYHLTVVVDDHEGGVTHVIRGEDHISNTPRQILIQEALGFPRPEYAHLPLLLATDRSKLSKRKGVTALSAYKEIGYLPEAMVNYLALLGWNPGTDQELFTLDELVHSFELNQVQKGGAVFDVEKLKWFNKQYLQKLSDEERLDYIVEGFEDEPLSAFLKTSPDMRRDIFERIHTREEFWKDAEAGEFDFYLHAPTYEAKNLMWKKEPNPALTKERLESVLEIVDNIEETTWTHDVVHESIWPLAERIGKGEVLWPTRYALSGRDRSPDPFTLLSTLGKAESINRLKYAVSLL